MLYQISPFPMTLNDLQDRSNVIFHTVLQQVTKLQWHGGLRGMVAERLIYNVVFMGLKSNIVRTQQYNSGEMLNFTSPWIHQNYRLHAAVKRKLKFLLNLLRKVIFLVIFISCRIYCCRSASRYCLPWIRHWWWWCPCDGVMLYGVYSTEGRCWSGRW